MTEQAIRALVDQDLSRVIGWAQDELRVRAEKRKHDTLAKIKEMAGAVGLSITIKVDGEGHLKPRRMHLPVNLQSEDRFTECASGYTLAPSFVQSTIRLAPFRLYASVQGGSARRYQT